MVTLSLIIDIKNDFCLSFKNENLIKFQKNIITLALLIDVTVKHYILQSLWEVLMKLPLEQSIIDHYLLIV